MPVHERLLLMNSEESMQQHLPDISLLLGIGFSVQKESSNNLIQKTAVQVSKKKMQGGSQIGCLWSWCEPLFGDGILQNPKVQTPSHPNFQRRGNVLLISSLPLLHHFLLLRQWIATAAARSDLGGSWSSRTSQAVADACARSPIQAVDERLFATASVERCAAGTSEGQGSQAGRRLTLLSWAHSAHTHASWLASKSVPVSWPNKNSTTAASSLLFWSWPEWSSAVVSFRVSSAPAFQLRRCHAAASPPRSLADL